MPTSELSDALNPYASQARQRPINVEYPPPNDHAFFQPIAAPPQQHVPHVSELQMAIAQPVSEPTPTRSRQGAQLLTELFRRLAATQLAQETEQQRRAVWEQEQEARFSETQAEMGRTILEMSDELAALRAKVDDLSTQPQPPQTDGLLTPQSIMSPILSQETNPTTLPISPQPIFDQGPSSHPSPDPNSSANCLGQANPIQTLSQLLIAYPQFESAVVAPVFQSVLSNPPLIEPSRPSPSSSGQPEKRKRRKKSTFSTSGNESSGSSSSSLRLGRPPRKRTSHHDTKCYTIQHAMRLHVLKMMDIETDKELPDSHIEGTHLRSSEPIRFFWEKTPKQSVHNSRMKARILDDIKENKQYYKEVSKNDFTKKILDATFEQCFITLRQKFKSQRNSHTASHNKKRENDKSRKARHLSRRKIKLNNRAEARNTMEMFEHVTFDGAMQLDCMSSEESDYEQDPNSSQPGTHLETRGHAWRSTRLIQFYCILDDEERIERMDSGAKSKRGQGKKERRIGLNKEGFSLPPQGASTWMISRRWYKASLIKYPDLPNVLTKLLVDPVGFNWATFDELGEETEDEDEPPLQTIFQAYNAGRDNPALLQDGESSYVNFSM